MLVFTDEEAVHALLRAGVEPPPGALGIAASVGDQGLVELFLERGMKPDDDGGFTPLQVAAKYGHLSIVKLLLKRGATVGAADEDGFTALHHAVVERHEDVVAVLIAAKALAAGADIDAKNHAGETPRSLAPGRDPEIVKLLQRKRR